MPKHFRRCLCHKSSVNNTDQNWSSRRLLTVALARLLCQQPSLPNALPRLHNRLVNLLQQRREVLLDAVQAHDDPRRTVTYLHQSVLLHRHTARKISTLELVRKKHRQIRLELRRVLLRVTQHDLRDYSDRTVDSADVDFALPFPRSWGVEDCVHDIILSVRDECQSFGVVHEGSFHQPQEVEIPSSAVQKLILRLWIDRFCRVVAETRRHFRIFARGCAYG